MSATMSIAGLINYKPNLFESMELPDGVDHDTTVNTIIMNCAELELLYPSGDFMETMIAIWSAAELPTWERVYKAVSAEYNPIENYDRQESWTDTNETTGTGTGTNKQAAFNTDEFAGTTKSESNTAGTGNNTHSGRVHGNIGVTTSAQMIRGELDLAQDANIYNYIAQSFKNRFCLMVY